MQVAPAVGPLDESRSILAKEDRFDAIACTPTNHRCNAKQSRSTHQYFAKIQSKRGAFSSLSKRHHLH